MQVDRQATAPLPTLSPEGRGLFGSMWCPLSFSIRWCGG